MALFACVRKGRHSIGIDGIDVGALLEQHGNDVGVIPPVENRIWLTNVGFITVAFKVKSWRQHISYKITCGGLAECMINT